MPKTLDFGKPEIFAVTLVITSTGFVATKKIPLKPLSHTGATMDLKTSVFFFSNSGRFSPLFCGAPAQITTMSALLQLVYSPE